MKTVKFFHLKDCDTEDVEFLEQQSIAYAADTANRILDLLITLDESSCGLKVTRLEHSLQSASRAWFDGADEDWLVAALLHDIGDQHAPFNHDEYAALILKPFVREQCAKTVEFHGEFQKYYTNGKIGKNPNVRDRFRDNAYFDDCVDFCERWDQNCFDPNYTPLPVEFFEPIVKRVFARNPHDPSIICPGLRVPLIDANQCSLRSKHLN